ncbi:hypothetical protein AX15_000389 [Amanita polypyramis BW_CC]|nr:hypothetical protein AX15_000389 [Amanita polypyramis BW_CC]
MAELDVPVDTDVAGTTSDTASKELLADVSTADNRSLRSDVSVYDPDAQQLVITSLRMQIQDLVGQVGQLNNKLVKSYNQISDLEDELHVASSHLRNSSLKVSQLELEHSQYLSALSTGLLVEKSNVTNELTRLMERATEEAAHRGQAESARVAIEKELDDLSANLFNQANTMVAEARYAQYSSERKMKEAESALRGAEEAVSMMQQQLQVLREEKELAEKRAQEVQASVGKGRWVEQRDGVNITRSLRLLSSHAPYQEFLLFVAHLRSIHISMPQLPSMSTLLALPFLHRLLAEDSEPTVRLDLAPALNWLSRRSVLAAIHNGQLVVEPISIGSLLSECNGGTISGMNSGGNDVPCALCGTPVCSKSDITSNHNIYPLTLTRSNGGTNSWSTTLFKRSHSNPYSGTNPPTPQRLNFSDYTQVFVFRVASHSTSMPVPSLPIPASSTPPPILVHSSSNSQSSTIYPLCQGSWCLARLRATCSLWSFVRTGIVEKIWEEEVPILAPPSKITVQAEVSKPPVPPRKRGLWGVASALGERAANWSEAAKKMAPSAQIEQQQQQQQRSSQDMDRKSLIEKQEPAKVIPKPPPLHPVEAASVPPLRASNHPLGPSSPVQLSTERAMAASVPVIPKRSEGRNKAANTSSQTGEVNTSTSTDQPQRPMESSKDSQTANPTQPVRTYTPPPIPPSPSTKHTSSPPPIPPRASGHKRHSSTLPERIPLPDSRPGTPLNGGPPSRTTSPAPVAGGIGVPPPIPRRAAARGTKLISSGEAGSRPGTPLQSQSTTFPLAATLPPDAEKAKETTLEIKPDVAKGTTATTENPDALKPQWEPAPEFVKLPEAPPAVEVPATIVEDRPSSTEDWKSVNVTPDAGSPGEEAAPHSSSRIEMETAPTKEVNAARVETQPSSGSNGGTINSSSEVSIPSDKSVFGSSKAASLFNSVSSNGNKLDIGEQVVVEKERDFKEVYVGDATWEERTWKELVRLREDMFWARIGALR